MSTRFSFHGCLFPKAPSNPFYTLCKRFTHLFLKYSRKEKPCLGLTRSRERKGNCQSTQTPFPCFDFHSLRFSCKVSSPRTLSALNLNISIPTFHSVQFIGRKTTVWARFHQCDNFWSNSSLQASTTFDHCFIKKEQVRSAATLTSTTAKKQFAQEEIQFFWRFYHIHSFSFWR